MNSKIIGIIILVVAIGGASTYFLTKSDPIIVNSVPFKTINQNDKVGLVINTVYPPTDISDIENSYKLASSSGIGRTNLYVYWHLLEPQQGNFDWTTTDILMKLNQKYNLKTTLYFSMINADRLGPFPEWMGNQALGKTLETNTIRVLDEILSRYENIDYVIFAGDIDYHFQRASATIPEYKQFFNNISMEIKTNHPNVKIGNSLSLENVVNKSMYPGGSFELTPDLKMGDFIAFSYKPTDTIGDIARTSDNIPTGKDTIWPAIDDFNKTLEMFPNTQIAFFEISWSTSDFVNGNEKDQERFVELSLNFFKENESKIEFFTFSKLFDKPKGTCVSQSIEEVTGSSFASNSYRLERADEYLCHAGLIDINGNEKPAWSMLKENIP